MTPQQPAAHPEWSELRTAEVLPLRLLGRRVGYFVNALTADSATADTLSHRRALKKDKPPEIICQEGKDSMDLFYGFHLYRCGYCQRLLLKPLQCSGCKGAVYCSRVQLVAQGSP